ncbi:MAG: glutamate--tRNA ligase [Dehalococcoidia bacterium]|jgi:glutamyl-tRNA synthetase
MKKPVRVRFAPSPTGYPHVGNIRTALFNWLFARHYDGKFIVRIEDTDVARRVEGAEKGILDSLRWLELYWDEGPDVGGDYGPYYQSQRKKLYKEAAEKLVAQGDAYYCYCSPERLEAMRAEQVKRKQPPGYDRHCRDLTPEERAEKEAEGITPVVRFKVPLEGKTRFKDLIYGDVVFENSTLDDFVLLKSDGYPTYHLANVVDDSAMKISHVIRAEEWVSSTPRHLMLYKALGLEPPEYIHHPMILGPDRAKLSKRHGSVSILEYRDQGYLAQTMFNFLALIGWSLDDKTEIIPRQALVDNFSLERIGKTGAIFNRDKLDWMNGVYIRALTPEEFFEAVQPYLMTDVDTGRAVIEDEEYVRKVLPLVQERVKKLNQVVELTRFFFVDELEYDPETLIGKKMDEEATVKALKAAQAKLQPLHSFDEESLEAVLRPLAPELELKTGQLFGVLRVATTGQTAAPPLFETMAVLGRERSMGRIAAALSKL